MLLASWVFIYYFKSFRSLNAENLRSVGQRALKLLAVKLWKWFDFARDRTRAKCNCTQFGGMAEAADFSMRIPILTASNFAALWSRDLKFSAFKDLNFFSIVLKVQEAGSILRVGFALSKWPHFDGVYLLRGQFVLLWIVYGRFCVFL